MQLSITYYGGNEEIVRVDRLEKKTRLVNFSRVVLKKTTDSMNFKTCPLYVSSTKSLVVEVETEKFDTKMTQKRDFVIFWRSTQNQDFNNLQA